MPSPASLAYAVAVEPEPRPADYRLQSERLTDAAARIAAVGGRWDERLARLDTVLAERHRAG